MFIVALSESDPVGAMTPLSVVPVPVTFTVASLLAFTADHANHAPAEPLALMLSVALSVTLIVLQLRKPMNVLSVETALMFTMDVPVCVNGEP
ncbi:hypothetical protein LMG28727_07690 [Paraburkholderia kirstenboschensis]|nr:hypothetical protein LMG28727_07690 [Paraburkholderia kirstenboschensis]